MYNLNNQKYFNDINFTARIPLSDKRLLKLPSNQRVLQSVTPLDFFYRENPVKQKMDFFSERLRAYIRVKQQKSKNKNSLTMKFLRFSYSMANRIRTVSSKYLALSNIRKFHKSRRLIDKIDVNKPEYIEEWAKVGNSVKDKYIHINIEDGIIEQLVNSPDNSIFILNHDNFEKDKFIYPIFNSLLNYGYSAVGKQADCPRPAIIVSKNLYKLSGPVFRRMYKKMGLIPIDASLTPTSREANLLPMRSIVSNFIRNKVNLFIFPEGNNSIFKNKSLREKFQSGIARIILSSLNTKKQVRVVPLGLAYDLKPNNMGSINIGSPLTFIKEGKHITCLSQENRKLLIANLRDKNLADRIVSLLCDTLQQSVSKSRSELVK